MIVQYLYNICMFSWLFHEITPHNLKLWNDTINHILSSKTPMDGSERVGNIVSDEIQGIYGTGGRIVGGKPEIIEKYPFHVSLQWTYGKDYYGAGVLITPKHVLTAAHCVQMDASGWEVGPDDIEIVAGRSFINETGVIRKPKTITIHPEYNMENKYNDIAVIEVDRPFELSTKINCIKMVTKRVRPLTKCTIMGFGSPSYGGPAHTNELNAVAVPIQTRFRCKMLFYKRLTLHDGQLCAGYYTGRRDACLGDSGGPMVCNGELGAVISAGIKCAKFYNPGIYTDVAYYREWIDEIIEQSSDWPVTTPGSNMGVSNGKTNAITTVPIELPESLSSSSVRIDNIFISTITDTSVGTKTMESFKPTGISLSDSETQSYYSPEINWDLTPGSSIPSANPSYSRFTETTSIFDFTETSSSSLQISTSSSKNLQNPSVFSTIETSSIRNNQEKETTEPNLSSNRIESTALTEIQSTNSLTNFESVNPSPGVMTTTHTVTKPLLPSSLVPVIPSLVEITTQNLKENEIQIGASFLEINLQTEKSGSFKIQNFSIQLCISLGFLNKLFF